MQQQQNNEQPRQFVERRQGKDWVTRFVPIIAGIGWVLAIVSLFFLDRARPEGENYFTHIFQTPVRTSWNTGLLRTALIILVLVFLVCAVGIIFNLMRKKRKTDKYNLPIIILGAISFAAVIGFVVMFRGVL